jgi:lipopolysaccharide export system protein LptA
MRAKVVALLLACGSAAGAQDQQRCSLQELPTTRISQRRTPSGQFDVFVGGGVRLSCPRSDLRLRADSLESYGDHGRLFLFGNVEYEEPRLNLTANYLTYYQLEERIVATGNVNARLPNGSTMRGPYAEYYRAMNGRPATRLFANGRPAFTIVQRDSAGNPGEPLLVLANNVTMVGDSLVYAGGSVQATRPEVEARGDSMTVDSEAERMVIMRNPVIEGRRNRPFTLVGERIELSSRNRKLERVLSLARARAVSEDLTLASDTIDLRFQDDLMERAIAWGPSRARAMSSTQELVADSLDVRMPAQRMREVFAVRGAAAYGRPDSTRFRADTSDWLRGDTIIARFDSVPGDTTRATRLRELHSRGGARAYYHLAPADTSLRRPAINYVTGREIRIGFRERQVATVTVVEQAAGVYLEPRPVAENPAGATVPATPATGTSAPPPPPAPSRRPPGQ